MCQHSKTKQSSQSSPVKTALNRNDKSQIVDARGHQRAQEVRIVLSDGVETKKSASIILGGDIHENGFVKKPENIPMVSMEWSSVCTGCCSKYTKRVAERKSGRAQEISD